MTTPPVRLAIAGATGRMGRQLLTATLTTAGVTLGAALVRPGSSLTGADAGELVGLTKTGVCLQTDIQCLIDEFDVLIDFTCPQTTPELLACCRQHHKSMVIGTTGLDQGTLTDIDAATTDIPLVLSANFSVGVNLLLTLLKKTAQVVGAHSDIEIIEAHHRYKVDAPSGTALAMGETIASALGKSLAQCAVYQRNGMTGERPPGSIGFATVRAGDIVGEHTALFASTGERLEISHKASSRMTFAHGAVRAASWLHRQQPGLYSMAQVLELTPL